ncbi:hypothetical protein ILT44_16790 [Microvirga sp. BT689]|nr:hypothetical protein [Microvirga arvi]MBM6581856.1 hypothetical protein [Microvirga arvi]
MVIEPRDLILGDGGDDGLLCVPYDATATIYVDVKAKQAAEEKTMAAT